MRLSTVSIWLLLASGATAASAQIKEDIVNARGNEAPCIGIGLGMAIVPKCVKLWQEQGFVKVAEVGYSGLTIGMTGQQDGTVVAVAAGSPAAAAGVMAGDVVVTVNGQPAALTPGTIAYARMFGEKGQEVAIKLRRAGSESEVKLMRVPAPVPANAPKGSIFLMIRPLVDWRGQFGPCLGAGPLASAAFALCDKKFKPHGFVRASELGMTGLSVNRERKDGAFVEMVQAGSPAASGGVQVGDEIVAVDGKPLMASVGENVREEMFARVGQPLKMTVRRGAADKTFEMTLVERPKDAPKDDEKDRPEQ